MINPTISNVTRCIARRQLSAVPHSFAAVGPGQLSEAAKATIELESKYGANNYAPLKVVLAKGKGKEVSWGLC
jgi:hypothetical protein